VANDFEKIKHSSLFTGIGGFDLAAEWMGWENVFQVEKDGWCKKVLTKNFPTVKRYGDIKEFNGSEYTNKIDILTGGFPCQPFSLAGSRKGKDDDRYLWKEMFRVICETKPPFVVGENVAGIIGMALEDVFADLESEGYEIETFIIPACAIGAAHRRDRVWIVAYNERYYNGRSYSNGRRERKQEEIISNVWRSRQENNGEWQIEPAIRRSIDGLSERMDTNRLKGLGNAIQPQVVYEIFKCIDFVLKGWEKK